jgi:hypothetical protein
VYWSSIEVDEIAIIKNCFADGPEATILVEVPEVLVRHLPIDQEGYRSQENERCMESVTQTNAKQTKKEENKSRIMISSVDARLKDDVRDLKSCVIVNYKR